MEVADGGPSHLGATFLKCWTVRSAGLSGPILKELYCIW